MASLPSLNTVTGALLLGSYFAISLYGLATHQVYQYYRRYPGDILITKVTVATIWIFDTCQSITVLHACYYYTVTNYFNPLALFDGVWSLRISLSLTAAVILVVHIFFSRRIYLLTKQAWISFLIMIFTAVPLASAIATTVISYQVVTFFKFEKFTWLICVTLGSNMIADVIITISLCWYLRRSKTGFQKTDSIIDKLLMYATNTGLLTIIYNTAVLICVLTMSDNLIYIGMFFVMSKLYVSSVLTVLNSRQGLLHNRDGSFGVSAISNLPPPVLGEVRSPSPSSARLHVCSACQNAPSYPLRTFDWASCRSSNSNSSYQSQEGRNAPVKLAVGL